MNNTELLLKLFNSKMLIIATLVLLVMGPEGPPIC